MPHGQLQAARQHAADEYIAYPQMGKSVAPGNFYQTICAIIFPYLLTALKEGAVKEGQSGIEAHQKHTRHAVQQNRLPKPGQHKF